MKFIIMKKTIITLTASLFAMLSPAQNLISSGSPLYKLPYKNTYVMQTLVAENTFRTAKVEKPKPGSFEQAKKVLPAPYWEGHEKEIEMYWKAWQIGIKNVCQPLDNSGFVTSYISPAYNGNIFMWDDAFITMFCRYGDRFFPFQKTLDNFYAKQHPDGFICREIRADGSDCFGRYDPTSTGPNLLPWSEWLYFTQFGDDNRLNKVFPVLAAYYKWLKLNRTWRNGTYWSSGWGTGMDNMPRVPEGYNTIYSNGHMIWLDACLQEDSSRPALVFMHHPPFITGMGAMDEPFEGADLLRDVLSRAPWARLCCGHMHRPIFTAWAQGLALTVPSISMQIDLDLSPEGGDTFRMEMPGYMLHRWDGSHLNSHVCQIPADVDFSGPHPFADSVNPVED